MNQNEEHIAREIGLAKHRLVQFLSAVEAVRLRGPARVFTRDQELGLLIGVQSVNIMDNPTSRLSQKLFGFVADHL